MIGESCYLSAVTQLKIDQRVFLSPSKRKLEVNIVQSNFHIEITPRCAICLALFYYRGKDWVMHLNSEAGNFDRVVIQELLKEIAQTQQVDLNAKQRFKGAFIVTSMFILYLYPLFMCCVPGSGNYQWGRLPLPRRASRSPPHDGEIHVKYANHSLRE